MKIQFTNSNSFKGYDVRPLRGFLMSSNPYSIANEMKSIGEKEGFKIYSVIKGAICTEGIQKSDCNTFNIWAQDNWTILKGNILSKKRDRSTEHVKEFFHLNDNELQKKLSSENEKLLNKHISGGNIFIVKGSEDDEILVGKDELANLTISEIKEMYGVNKVIVLPQMDFHLDLFIRPLDNKKILLADDNLTLDVIKKGYEKFLKFYSGVSPKERKKYQVQDIAFRNMIRDCEFNQAKNGMAKSEEIEKILKNEGYDVIKVPGRIYDTRHYKNETYLNHLCNYMNANVIRNSDGKLVYITNKSSVDEDLELKPELSEKIDFSFENEFVKSISKYIDKEHIYFINGDADFAKNDMLYTLGGGIHCVCSEIPL